MTAVCADCAAAYERLANAGSGVLADPYADVWRERVERCGCTARGHQNADETRAGTAGQWIDCDGCGRRVWSSDRCGCSAELVDHVDDGWRFDESDDAWHHCDRRAYWDDEGITCSKCQETMPDDVTRGFVVRLGRHRRVVWCSDWATLARDYARGHLGGAVRQVQYGPDTFGHSEYYVPVWLSCESCEAPVVTLYGEAASSLLFVQWDVMGDSRSFVPVCETCADWFESNRTLELGAVR